MSWILTASGRKISVDAIEPQDVVIDDLAAALSKICRFTGHCRIFWSVADHSMLVSEILREREPLNHELQLCGLLHDAPEAYLQDIATPLKNMLGTYRLLEQAAWWAVAERFGLPLLMPTAVKIADLQALATERRDLMPEHDEPWSVLEGIKPVATRLGDHEPDWRTTERRFIERFHELIFQRALISARSVT